MLFLPHSAYLENLVSLSLQDRPQGGIIICLSLLADDIDLTTKFFGQSISDFAQTLRETFLYHYLQLSWAYGSYL